MIKRIINEDYVERAANAISDPNVGIPAPARTTEEIEKIFNSAIEVLADDGDDHEFFCNDELSLSSGRSTMGKPYIVLTEWDEIPTNRHLAGNAYAFTADEARAFADKLRRFADKIDKVKLP